MKRTLLTTLAEWFVLWCAVSIALACAESAEASAHFPLCSGDPPMRESLTEMLATHEPESPFPDDLPAGVQVTEVGPVVVDTYISPVLTSLASGQKHDCTFRRTFGGAAWNIDEQLRRLSVRSRPILLVGDDDLGRLITPQIDDRSPDAVVLAALEQTRETAIIDGECYTVRSPVADRRAGLRMSAITTLESASVIILAPMLPDDYDFQLQVLAHMSPGAKVILQLSNQQCADSELAIDLGRRVWLVALNASPEAQLCVGTSDPRKAIRRLRARGVKNVLVTHTEGVDAFIDGDAFRLPRYETQSASRPVGAGDWLLATFAAIVACGGDKPDYEAALRYGLAAAALHVEGRSQTGSRAALAEVIANRPAAIDFDHVPSFKPWQPAIRVAAQAAAAAQRLTLPLATAGSGLVGLGLGWLLGSGAIS